MKTVIFGNWLVTDKHFTEVGKEQTGLKNKWKTERDGEYRSLCSEKSSNKEV